MKKFFYITIILAHLLMGLSAPIFGANTSVTGIASVNYKSSFLSSQIDKKTKDKAIKDAILNAWKKYTSSFNTSRYNTYIQHENDFINNIDKYISENRVIDEKTDKKQHEYTVAVKILINNVAVESRFIKLSPAGGENISGEGSMFSFIFVARDTTSIKNYDAKRVRIEERNYAISSEESSSMSGSKMAVDESNKKKRKIARGGSTERKADKLQYTITSSSDVDAAMNEILSPAGFEVVDYGDIVSECGGAEPSIIKNEFTTQAELSRQTRAAAINGARLCDVPLFAIGTLDAGLADTDPVSGLKRVYVSVNAKVYNIAQRLPKKIASVGPVQYAGLGPDAVVAKKNALTKAGKEAAQSIVDQLNDKQIN